jgi:hypothetical protein
MVALTRRDSQKDRVEPDHPENPDQAGARRAQDYPAAVAAEALVCPNQHSEPGGVDKGKLFDVEDDLPRSPMDVLAQVTFKNGSRVQVDFATDPNNGRTMLAQDSIDFTIVQPATCRHTSYSSFLPDGEPAGRHLRCGS